MAEGGEEKVDEKEKKGLLIGDDENLICDYWTRLRPSAITDDESLRSRVIVAILPLVPFPGIKSAIVEAKRIWWVNWGSLGVVLAISKRSPVHQVPGLHTIHEHLDIRSQIQDNGTLN